MADNQIYEEVKSGEEELITRGKDGRTFVRMRDDYHTRPGEDRDEKIRHKSPRQRIRDSDWLKNTFMITEDPEEQFSRWVDNARFASTADRKITCARIGMGLAVNPKPSITRNADILRVGRIHKRDETGDFRYGVPHYGYNTIFGSFGGGMGRGYSEIYDDNEQRIFLQFGEPQPMNMLYFLSKSFDVNKAILYKRGFITRTLLSVVNNLAEIFAITAMPWLYATKLLFEAIIMPPRFVTLRDNMYTYWSIVDTLVNKMFVRRARVPLLQTPNATKGSETFGGGGSLNASNDRTVSAQFIASLNSVAPGIVNAKTGRISVFTIALRTAAAYNAAMLEEVDYEEEIPERTNMDEVRLDSDMSDYFSEADPALRDNFVQTLFKKADETIGSDMEDSNSALADMKAISEAMGANETYKSVNWGSTIGQDELPRMHATYIRSTKAGGDPFAIKTVTKDGTETADGLDQADLRTDYDKKAAVRRFGNYLMESLKGGFSFAIFNVENTGATSESFSNSTQSNPLETTFNSMSSKLRSLTNAAAPMTEIPIIGDAMKFAADATSIVLSKVTMGLANPLLALFYGSTVNLPKAWAEASASLPSGNYRVRCCPPYGNSYSHLFDMYLPLAMILAGTLSRSTGLHTYTSPFLCRLYDVGRVNIDLGIISNLTITRGVSNLTHNRAGHANAIDLEFTITDLNDIVSLELGNNAVISSAAKAILPDASESTMDTYINTITGLDVYTQFYKVPKMRLKLIDKHMELQTLFDPAAMAAASGNIITSITPNFINNAARELMGDSAPARVTRVQY